MKFSPGTNLFDFEKNPHAPGRPISDDDVADPSFATASVSRGRGSLCFPPPHHPVLLLRRVLWRRSWLRIPNARRHPQRTPPSSRPSPSASTTAQRSSAPLSEPPSLDASSSALHAPVLWRRPRGPRPRTQQPAADKSPEENRFIRRREAAKQAAAEPPSAPCAQ
jgi:hypothetical protein